MERRQFTDEFKREAVKLTRQPGASKAGIAKDLGINANILGRWAREQQGNPLKANGGNRLVVSNDEFERMRRELAKLRTERDILKKRLATSLQSPSEVRLYHPTSSRLADTNDVSGHRGFCQRLL